MSDGHPTQSPPRRKILIRGVNWLGDAVMTTPALQRIREALPGSHLTLLTPAKLSALWDHHPSLDTVLTFAAGERVWSVAQRLRREEFQTALILPNSARSALESWLARIPERIGYARGWRAAFLTGKVPTRSGHVRMRKRSTGEIRRLIGTEPSPPSQSRTTYPTTAHHIYEYLHLGAALGAKSDVIRPLISVTEEEVRAAALKFKVPAAPGGRRLILGLNAGAEYGPAKRWPTDRFIAAAREIHKRVDCIWLLLGTRADLPITMDIASAIRTSSASVHNLAGQTSLRELCAVLKLCNAVLTNDSGPMHLAAALGTHVVVPFGSTSPELTGPGSPGDTGNRLLIAPASCAPCFRRTCPIDFRCMAGIGVAQVVAATLDVAGTPKP